MGDFFDDISRRAEARRNLTFEKQKTLLNSGILTPSMTNGSLDGNLTDEQIIEKNDMIEAEEQQAYNDAIALPVGMAEGAAGILGDVEILGQGIGGAYNAERGQKWDGFVDAMRKRQEEGTTFWNTLENMERTDGWLEGTELGDRLKDGSGGRLVGEILAPIPVPKGVMQAGKIGAKIATHPMTRYAAETAKTEVFNAINNVNPNSVGGRGISMFTPPKQNMVIGQGSSKFDMPSYNEFKKQIDVEKVMANRKKTGKFAPTPDEQRLWEETSKRGNPTFIDADGIIKQEIPTGTMNLKAPLLKGQPQFALRNLAMNSYKGARGRGLDTQTRLAHMTDEVANRTGANAYVNGNDITLNPNLSKADFNESLAHEAQHMIQDAENFNGAKWSTGSSPDLFTGRMFDEILERAEEAEEVFSKEFDKLVKAGKVTEDEYFDVMQEVTPNLFSAQVRKDALLGMRDYDNLKFGEKSKNHFYNNGDKPYFADAGELTPRVTGARAHLNKQGIADNHILNAMDEDFKGFGFTTKDMYPPDVLERFKSGQLRDKAVIDELNKTEYGQMLDDELTKFSASNFKQAIKDTIKKRKHPKVLQKGGFKVNDISGTMGHGYEVKFTMDGSDWSFGIPSTPRNPENAAKNILHNVGKFFTKGSDWYLDKDLADIIVKPGDDVSRKLLSDAKANKRTSYSMPNPDAKLFDDLDEGVIPKNRQNQVTKLVKSPLGTEIEKPLGYRGDPMLDSNWDNFIFSSQKPGSGAIKYIPDNSLHNKGLAGPSKPIEDVPPMNNVLDANGNITKQPSTGLNSEAISNMNPMEVARGQGVRGYAELKEELRALYKEATGDPGMQKQIRDKIVEVDKQMNMFDADVAKPRKSIYEESTGFNDEGDEILRHSNPEDPYSPDKSASHNIDRDIRTAESDDSFFTGKGALPENPNTISDIGINAGGTPTAPVMIKAADKKLVKSITNSLNNMRRSPDETINEILRHISDLEAKPVPKQARLAQADKVAKDKMLKYAYEAIEAIQRNSYMGVDSLGTKLTRSPTNALDNIGVQTAETYVPKVNKPKFDNPQDYEFDEMLRSWDKEAQNIKTRDRYLPNGKRLDRSKLRDHEDPVKGALPDYGRGRVKKKDNDFFGELEEPRTSYSMPSGSLPRSLTHGTGSQKNTLMKIPDSKVVDGVRVNAKTGHPMGTDEDILKAKKEFNEHHAIKAKQNRDGVKATKKQTDAFNKARKKFQNVSGEAPVRKIKIPESMTINGKRINKKTRLPMESDDVIYKLNDDMTEARRAGDKSQEYHIRSLLGHAKGLHKKGGRRTVNQDWYKALSKRDQQDYLNIRDNINAYKKENSSRRGSNADESLLYAWKVKHSPTYSAENLARSAQRRATKLERTPKGQTKADRDAIQELYVQANNKTKKTGEAYHVDHIFPLQPVTFTTRYGKEVKLKQGWHEPDNLQVMKGSDNVSKGNRILPEQYEEIIKRLNPQDKIDFMDWYEFKGLLND